MGGVGGVVEEMIEPQKITNPLPTASPFDKGGIKGGWGNPRRDLICQISVWEIALSKTKKPVCVLLRKTSTGRPTHL
jgi:hypothetical protein